MNINKTILEFFSGIKNDPNHRYKSWEHCYSYFKRENIDNDVACLHLSFYLASWGMYRGSSPLLWKDYLIHSDVIREILKHKKLQRFQGKNVEIEEIIRLKQFLKKYYTEKITVVNDIGKKYTPSDVLISKILLGTLGCTPAFDRYFVDGMRKEKIKPLSFNEKSLKALVNFYSTNKAEFEKAQKEISKESKTDYPPMKLVDMFFWQTGFKNLET